LGEWGRREKLKKIKGEKKKRSQLASDRKGTNPYPLAWGKVLFLREGGKTQKKKNLNEGQGALPLVKRGEKLKGGTIQKGA